MKKIIILGLILVASIACETDELTEEQEVLVEEILQDPEKVEVIKEVIEEDDITDDTLSSYVEGANLDWDKNFKLFWGKWELQDYEANYTIDCELSDIWFIVYENYTYKYHDLDENCNPVITTGTIQGAGEELVFFTKIGGGDAQAKRVLSFDGKYITFNHRAFEGDHKYGLYELFKKVEL